MKEQIKQQENISQTIEEATKVFADKKEKQRKLFNFCEKIQMKQLNSVIIKELLWG